MVALGQPPNPEKQPEKKAVAAKPVDPVEKLIAAALANDSDVRVAQAKITLAEAELGKARQAVTQRVVTLNAQIAELKRSVEYAEQNYRLMEELFKKAALSQTELLPARERLENAKGKLATAEIELKLLTGGGPKAAGAAADWGNLNAVHSNAVWGHSCVACHAVPDGKLDAEKLALRIDHFVMGRQVAAGPIPTRLRVSLDKPIKLGANGEKVTFEKALEVFKTQAGLDVPVRVDAKVGAIASLGEELPVGAWLQLFADGTPDLRIVVREYGLLVTSKMIAPPDAISVFDFWKQKPKVDEAPKK
jgi:hypothetical protein